MSEKLDVVGGNRKEQRWTVAFDHLEHTLGSWRPGQQDAGSAHGQWKVKSVSQSVGKEKLGYTEAAILIGNVQYAFGIPFRTHHHVVLQMNASLRPPRTAGRVEPKGGIVFAGRLCLEHGWTLLCGFFEREGAWWGLAAY